MTQRTTLLATLALIAANTLHGSTLIGINDNEAFSTDSKTHGGISTNGNIIVGNAAGSGGFIWNTSTNATQLFEQWSYPFGDAADISGDGTIITGTATFSDGTKSAYRWTSVNGAQPIGILSGYDKSYGEAISADGTTIVGSCYSIGDGITTFGGETAFRWTQSTGMVALGQIAGGSNSTATAVSSNGSVIAGYDSQLNQAFRWTQETGMQTIGRLAGATDCTAIAISGDGSIIIGSSGTKAFKFTTEGGIQDLGNIEGATQASASGISEDGSIIVGHTDAGAFIWDASNGMRKISDLITSEGTDTSNWEITDATGVTTHENKIIISGYGIKNGQNEAFTATINNDITAIPEASTYGIICTGALALIAGAKRRRRH